MAYASGSTGTHLAVTPVASELTVHRCIFRNGPLLEPQAAPDWPLQGASPNTPCQLVPPPRWLAAAPSRPLCADLIPERMPGQCCALWLWLVHAWASASCA